MKVVELEKFSFSDTQKHYLLNRDNLTQRTEIQLSEKQKNISWIFFCIFKIYIKFQTFANKRRPSQLMFFQKYRLRKTWLDLCPKSLVSEDP